MTTVQTESYLDCRDSYMLQIRGAGGCLTWMLNSTLWFQCFPTYRFDLFVCCQAWVRMQLDFLFVFSSSLDWTVKTIIISRFFKVVLSCYVIAWIEDALAQRVVSHFAFRWLFNTTQESGHNLCTLTHAVHRCELLPLPRSFRKHQRISFNPVRPGYKITMLLLALQKTHLQIYIFLKDHIYIANGSYCLAYHRMWSWKKKKFAIRKMKVTL